MSSSLKTMEKPWSSKDFALRIWSPRLEVDGSGISRLGLWRARSSPMALAPARDTTRSDIANISGSSSVIYSYCLYPSTVRSILSCLSLPVRWTILKSLRSSLRASRIAPFTEADPWLPPITIITGLSSLKPTNSLPLSALPFKSSSLMGDPVSTAFSGGTISKVSGKLQHTTSADDRHSLLASPGVISDSCIMQGIFKRDAALTTGPDTNPPFEKSTLGFNFLRIFLASKYPFITLKGSVKFLGSKYLRSFPLETP